GRALSGCGLWASGHERRLPGEADSVTTRGRLPAPRLRVRPAVDSRFMYERPGYQTLLGRIRDNIRLYIRKQIELPKQEIAEIIRANVRAVMWFGVAFAFVLGALISLTVLVIALIALVLPWWASALIVLALFLVLAGLTGFIGYKKLDLRAGAPAQSQGRRRTHRPHGRTHRPPPRPRAQAAPRAAAQGDRRDRAAAEAEADVLRGDRRRDHIGAHADRAALRIASGGRR